MMIDKKIEAALKRQCETSKRRTYACGGNGAA
jgi:hypothetical protein